MTIASSVQIFVVSVQDRQSEVTGLQTGWQLLWQTNLIPPQHHQVHGRQKLLQAETTILGHVRQLPDLSQLLDW